MGSVAAAVVAALPFVSSAQEYLPPVIDRSVGAQERPAQQGSAAPAAAPQQTLSIDERLKRVERLVDNQGLVDMLMRLDTLQADSQALRGEMETLTHDMETLKQRQRDLYLDIDRRLSQLETAAARAPVAAAPTSTAPASSAPAAVGTTGAAVAGAVAGAAATTAVTAPATAGVAVAPTQERGDPAKEREAYQKAFNTLKDGQYEQAITEFHNFLSLYPAGDYSDNAQYWLGEPNYATRRFDVAAQEFRKLLDQQPGSSKAADAMLKLGYSYYELAQWDLARKTLTDVVNRYANTTAARLAESRLQKMRLEGR